MSLHVLYTSFVISAKSWEIVAFRKEMTVGTVLGRALKASNGAQCPVRRLVGQDNVSGNVHRSLICNTIY